MKITKRQLRRIILESFNEVDAGDKFTIGKADSRGTDHLFPDDVIVYGDEEYTRDDLYDMISDFSKELTGRRRTYFRPELLDQMNTQQVSDYYSNMSSSSQTAGSEISNSMSPEVDDGYDAYSSPKRQGMGRRNELKQRLKNILKEKLSHKV